VSQFFGKEEKMGQRGLKWAAAFAACLCLGGVSYGAEDADVKALLERVKAMESKNAELESKLNSVQSSRSEIDRAMARADASLGTVVTNPDPFGRPLRIGGYLDVAYQFNINRPADYNTSHRIYDNQDNDFSVHAVELNFDRLPTKAGESGFRFDLLFGQDAAFGGAAVEAQQAYLSYIAPLGNGLTIDVGRFVTSDGAETVEAADNLNHSRSILFNYAIPTRLTGARLSYPIIKDKWTMGMVVANGWDNAQDNNNSKYVNLSTAVTFKKFSFTLTASTSNETAANVKYDADAADGSLLVVPYRDKGDYQRSLIDAVVRFSPIKKLEFAINADFGTESANVWYGVAGYAKYQFNKKWYVGARGEYFVDRGGHDRILDDEGLVVPDANNNLIPNNAAAGPRLGRSQSTWEGTLTLDYALAEPLHMRLEGRFDQSNNSEFADYRHVNSSDHQTTVSVSWLYKF
jgi:hypothetical protein